MSDFEASWRKWAAMQYSDPAIAGAAATAGFDATRRGVPAQQAAVVGHRAAVAAGGEYVCRPDLTGIAIVTIVLVFLLLVPATIAGLTVNPGFSGYLFLAAAVLVPGAALAGVLLVRKNSCFFVDRWSVGRRDWRGRVVMTVAREGVAGAEVERGSWSTAFFGEEQTQSGGHPDESKVAITLRSGDRSVTPLFWWSSGRAAELVAVARP